MKEGVIEIKQGQQPVPEEQAVGPEPRGLMAMC